MPWTGQEFREKHNKNLTPAKAKRAAKIATAMVRKGVPEGEAIATANAKAKSDRKPVRLVGRKKK